MFQIAAHEDVVPVPELYRMCEAAYRIVVDGLGVGRVIARPFVGPSGAYMRTANRHDYAMPSPEPTLLDRLAEAAVPVIAIGKIADLFAGRGITRKEPTPSDDAGVDAVVAAMRDEPEGLIFANLVDFDTQYGHRNDVQGYTDNLERFDRRLPEILSRWRQDDLLVITADHGNDPTTPSTDHSRSTCRACHLRPAWRTGSIWEPATRLPISGRPLPTSLASARFGTAPASSRAYVSESVRNSSSASATSLRRRRPSPPTLAGASARRRKTTSDRRFSATATA